MVKIFIFAPQKLHHNKGCKIMSLKYVTLLLLTLAFQLTALPLIAHDSDSTAITTKRFRKGAGLYYQAGSILHTHPFVSGDNPSNKPYGLYQSFSAKYYILTDGRKAWQQLYGYPQWGFGIYKAFVAHDQYLGNPSAVYSFINLPLSRWKIWSLNFEIGFGLSFNWKPHSVREDQYAYPIGSFSTVFFDAGINASFHLTAHIDLTAGLSYTHFSDGALKLPNLGVNMVAPRLEVEYIFSGRPEYTKREIAPYQKEWEWLILLAPSKKQLGFEYVKRSGDTSAVVYNYNILSISTTINRQISHKIKFGGGFDISYNEAYAAETVMQDGIPQKAPYNTADKILIGIYPSIELVLHNLSLIAQPGYYIYKKAAEGDNIPVTYQRVGVKYSLGDHLLLGVNIRAFNFSKADFIEWIVGYRLKWQKSYRKREGVI